MTVKLNDIDETVLVINTPTKAVFDVLFECFGKLNEIDTINDPETIKESLGELYEACAMAMSHNKNRKHITAADLEKMFDFEDLLLFFNTYMDFVGEVASTKN
jgi:hypothetical protein